MKSYLIKNTKIVNEDNIFEGDLLIRNGRIEKLGRDLSSHNVHIIEAEGLHLLPGLIDDQVHFREPGLTHKGEIYTESKAAVAGGTTSYMEMPNTIPNALTQELLAEKYAIASHRSLANYSFFLGASNDNLKEVLRTDPSTVCGIKIFMGSSTGNMLVDNERALENIFKESRLLIATHCEDEQIIRKNEQHYREQFGEDVPVLMHPKIRSTEACFKSSSHAVELAKRFDTRLHILHISTAKEIDLFRNDIPLKQKRITAEVCLHHLWFEEHDYVRLGTRIKWNPAVKSAADKQALLAALLDDRLDVLATDHAPHILEEKEQSYFKAPSGGPLVQHALVALVEMYHQGKISLEKIVRKSSHAVADCFHIRDRGFIREGYFADLVLVDLQQPWKVEPSNILAKCGWSPFEGQTFQSAVTHTFVSGHLAYERGVFHEEKTGERLLFQHD